MKSARIAQYLASDAVQLQEDKYALQQQILSDLLVFYKSLFLFSGNNGNKSSIWGSAKHLHPAGRSPGQ